MDSLPTNWKLINPTFADLDRLTEYQISYDLEIFGFADTTREDIEVEWKRDGFRLEHDAWFLITPDGNIAGYTDFWQREDELYITHNTNIHPNFRHLVPPMLFYNMGIQTAEAQKNRSIRQIRTISVDPYTEDLLSKAGFTATQVQWRMVHTFVNPVEIPTLPMGYRLLPYNNSDHAKQVHELIETAFSELPHRHRNSFEAWSKFIIERPDFEPELLKMVFNDDELCAAAVGFDSDLGGWVRQLAVKRSHRGKGLAQYLLRVLFRVYQDRGRKDVGLIVDSENRTGAPELYQKVGMVPTEKYITFVKSLDAV